MIPPAGNLLSAPLFLRQSLRPSPLAPAHTDHKPSPDPTTPRAGSLAAPGPAVPHRRLLFSARCALAPRWCLLATPPRLCSPGAPPATARRLVRASSAHKAASRRASSPPGPPMRHHSPELGHAAASATTVPRRNVLSTMLSTSTILLFGPRQITLAETTGGSFREYIDIFDGYTFLYPKSWIQVKGAGADIFFRDPFVLDENMSVEISSPSSSKYASVEDLGPPEKAAEKVLKQYLTEFMSTRLGVRRESNVLSAVSKVADDGKLYYEVEVNIKSYASNNELAVMPQDRVQSLEWDRRYLSVLGVENKRLYELRLQTPEQVFMEEEDDLRRVMDSFRVIKTA